MEPIVSTRRISNTFGSMRFSGETGREGTLVSCRSGIVAADTGEIRIGKAEVTANGATYATLIRDEIAHVQQTPRLFDLLTVAEKLFRDIAVVQRRGWVRHRQMVAKAGELLQTWGIDISPTALPGQLGAGTRSLLEIIRALNRDVPAMILDEPTAALPNAEKRVLFDHVRALTAQGVTFVSRITSMRSSRLPTPSPSSAILALTWRGSAKIAGLLRIEVINKLLTLAQVPSFHVPASTGAAIIWAATENLASRVPDTLTIGPLAEPRGLLTDQTRDGPPGSMAKAP